MGNHCVEVTCAECGYECCARCSSAGFVSMDTVKTLYWYSEYLKDKENNKLSRYLICPKCGKKAMK